MRAGSGGRNRPRGLARAAGRRRDRAEATGLCFARRVWAPREDWEPSRVALARAPPAVRGGLIPFALRREPGVERGRALAGSRGASACCLRALGERRGIGGHYKEGDGAAP